MTRQAQRTGGEILVDALRTHGVDLVFGVPGESYLAVLDAFYGAPEAIRFIVCRQEGGAANMADAYGKLTGRPGICFVTRGPGACNASIGVHTAFQDSTPMILFIGQVARDQRDREAFQEVDFCQMFSPLAKWVAEIIDPARIPEIVSHAFHVAVSGRPGPIVLALPEDMLRERSAVPDTAPYQPVHTGVDQEVVERIRGMLAAAKRPVMIVGGGGWTAETSRNIQVFSEANGVPVATSFRCQDYFSNDHDLYIGDVGIGIAPTLAKRIRGADLLLVVGARLGEMTTQGYSLIDVPRPTQKLIHAHPSADELGRVYQGDLLVACASPRLAAALQAMPPVDGAAWRDWARDGRREYLESMTPQPQPGQLDMGKVMIYLSEHLPTDAIVTNGAGNFSAWVHKYYMFRTYRTQLAPTSGAMGYGVPAAMAAKLVYPERPVVCFAGDGDFMMNPQELATAVQYGLDPIILVVNNGMYGTIRMHQERHYPGRVMATDLNNPDFAAFAASFGGHGEVVERTEHFPAAFERAEAAGRLALIELRIDPEGIAPRTTLTSLRTGAQ